MTEQQEKAKFRQAVDHTLASLEGDPFLYQCVAARCHKEEKSVKKMMPRSIVLAVLVVLCLSTVAVAAVMLNYSPETSALKLARETVMDKYGLSQTVLGLFTHDMRTTEGCMVFEFRCDVVDVDGQEIAGRYIVTVPDNGEPTATWSYDAADPDVWQSGDMNAPIWGPVQLETFLRDRTHAGTVDYHVIIEDDMLPAVTPTPAPVFAVPPVWTVEPDVAPDANDLTEEQARELAVAALADSYALTTGDVANMDVFYCTLQESFGGAHQWHVNAYLYRDGYDWNMYVVIDAVTGEIIDIGMQTGGNG